MRTWRIAGLLLGGLMMAGARSPGPFPEESRQLRRNTEVFKASSSQEEPIDTVEIAPDTLHRDADTAASAVFEGIQAGMATRVETKDGLRFEVGNVRTGVAIDGDAAMVLRLDISATGRSGWTLDGRSVRLLDGRGVSCERTVLDRQDALLARPPDSTSQRDIQDCIFSVAGHEGPFALVAEQGPWLMGARYGEELSGTSAALRAGELTMDELTEAARRVVGVLNLPLAADGQTEFVTPSAGFDNEPTAQFRVQLAAQSANDVFAMLALDRRDGHLCEYNLDVFGWADVPNADCAEASLRPQAETVLQALFTPATGVTMTEQSVHFPIWMMHADKPPSHPQITFTWRGQDVTGVLTRDRVDVTLDSTGQLIEYRCERHTGPLPVVCVSQPSAEMIAERHLQRLRLLPAQVIERRVTLDYQPVSGFAEKPVIRPRYMLAWRYAYRVEFVFGFAPERLEGVEREPLYVAAVVDAETGKVIEIEEHRKPAPVIYDY